MNTELIKCTCTVCSGHLEFEADHAGDTIPCPHCGVDTVLFIPSRLTGARVPKPRALRRLFIALAAGLVLFAGLTWGIYYLATHRTVAESTATGAAAGTYLVVMLALAVVACLIALLWLLFPVFVYFAIGRFEKLLQQIERNTRPRP